MSAVYGLKLTACRLRITYSPSLHTENLTEGGGGQKLHFRKMWVSSRISMCSARPSWYGMSLGIVVTVGYCMVFLGLRCQCWG